MDLNKIAAILQKAHEELKNVKRNPSGTPNGNAYNAIRRRAVNAMKEAGEDGDSARTMFYDLSKKALPEVKIW